MTEIIYLTHDDDAPESRNKILISINVEGKFDTTIWHDQKISYDYGRWPLDQAIQRARRDANYFNIPVIHVRASI